MPTITACARHVLVVLLVAVTSWALVAAGADAARHAPRGRHHHAGRAHAASVCATARKAARRHHARARHRRRVHGRACARVADVASPVLVAPGSNTVVPRGHGLRGKAHETARVHLVAFQIDGRTVKNDRARPYTFTRRRSRLSPGTHTVQAVAVRSGVRYPSKPVTIDVTGDGGGSSGSGSSGASGGSGGAGDTAWAQGKTWASSFETGDFSEWSWWGQGQGDLWGHTAVVNPASVGIPPLGGDHVARFETTPDDVANGRYHAKLYQGFGTDLEGASSRPPRDVSGVYSCWYYVPDTYSVPDHTSVNIFQFKDEYRTPGGSQSDPLWWVQLGPVHWADSMSRGYGGPPITGRPDAPVAFLNYWNNDWHEKRNFVPLPLDRWFEIQAVVHQGDRIDFFLDGRPFDTARASTYPVSPFHGAQSMAWTFGIGNYSTGVNGPLYTDRASYTASS